ncbi:hypothetical protein KC330_g201 [Hortaea werneckii]|nr:hypothetical protein KC330_g201 [Hortaea werneckii]
MYTERHGVVLAVQTVAFRIHDRQDMRDCGMTKDISARCTWYIGSCRYHLSARRIDRSHARSVGEDVAAAYLAHHVSACAATSCKTRTRSYSGCSGTSLPSTLHLGILSALRSHQRGRGGFGLLQSIHPDSRDSGRDALRVSVRRQTPCAAVTAPRRTEEPPPHLSSLPSVYIRSPAVRTWDGR